MGSLPDLTDRPRPPPRPAARTISDPHRNRTVLPQIPVHTVYKKQWPWRISKAPFRTPPVVTSTRRRDSVASSVGAASVRRLIMRPPPKLPRHIVRRFTLLCFASGLSASALTPFTAFAGAEAAAMPLALMHSMAAVVAPFSPLILQKTGARVIITLSYSMITILLSAHAVDTPLSLLMPLYAFCGITLSPMSLALSASATSLAQTAGDEMRRKVVLRRALRALRAAQDLGLVFGSLLIAVALFIWPEVVAQLTQEPPVTTNVTIPRWPPPEEYFLDEDYEDKTCGAAGCPDTQSISGVVVNAEGRRILVTVWAGLALTAIGLGVFGSSSTPSPPPDDARSVVKDLRAILSIPMGLFIGIQQGFIYTSYVKWYAVCVGGWGTAWRALFGAGVLQALAAGTLSMAAARGRRGALAAGGAAAHASLVLALLRWRAARADLALPAVAAAAWGACAALWDVLQAGICIGGPGWRGPWSVTLASRHAGLALACAARHLLCARMQLAALAAVFCAALASHAALEVKLRKGEPLRHRS